MAEGKKSVLFYVDWIDTFDDLTDEEAGKLIKHFLRYVNDKNPEAPDRITKLLFDPIKNTLKRDLKKWEEKTDKKSESGIIGNLKRWHLDLFEKFNSGQITLDMALSIAETRKTSQPDEVRQKASQNIAVIDRVIVSDIVTDTVIEKEIVNNKKSSVKNSATPTLSIEKFKTIAAKSFEDNSCLFGTPFKILWLNLIQTKKWRKKEQSAINLSLKKLMDFDEEFSIVLVENAIAGEYQGVVFQDTNNHYEKYLKQKNGTGTQSTDAKAQSRANLKNLAIEILSSENT